MPPFGLPRPDQSTLISFIQSIETSLDEASEAHPNPGASPAHRLNRAEYANAVRDLVGVGLDVTSLLPPDDSAYGFDNIASALSISSGLMERYLGAASRIAAATPKTLTCRPNAAADEASCARSAVMALARRAWRRSVTGADVAPLLAFYEDGRREGSFDEGMQRAIEAILMSPEFLFRVETSEGNLSDFELASRLSFFLWSTIPDDHLLELAEQGKLSNTSALERETARMLADPRSNQLIRNFAGQWLYLRNLRYATPDAVAYPQFDADLRQAFATETELFFESILRENRSVVDLVDANYTFLNERLARHYGIPGVVGPEFRRVQLTDPQRGGLLGQGSILTVTSYDNRTSVAKRGKWILENILGAPPPPPPPEVPSLKAESADGRPLTLRRQMEAHSTDSACASCHVRIDALGFALENYDGIGAWRASDAGAPIDAAATMPDGARVDGLPGLRAALRARPDRFVDTITQKLLTYALGRGLEYYDQPAVRAIEHEAAADNYRLAALITAIVKSTPFRMRKAPAK